MKQRKVLISTVMLLLLVTGCVKPTDEPNQSNATVYNEQPATEAVYEDGTPVIYSEPAVVTNAPVYVEEQTVVSTGGYEQAATPTTGPFDDPFASGGGGGTNIGSEVFVDPYTNGGAAPASAPNTYNNNNSYTDNNSYTNNNSYANNNAGGGIHLQVTALKDFYAAENFKNSLSLDPKYSAYVKKGAINKVIVKGFSTRAEAKALAARQFPGAFIVAGSSSYSGGSSYTPAPSYTPTPSYNPPVSGNANSGIGVQVGAFSSQATARNAAESAAAGRYTAIVKTVHVRGKTLYKAILLGFSSRAEAKRAIDAGQFGSAFVVSNIYP